MYQTGAVRMHHARFLSAFRFRNTRILSHALRVWVAPHPRTRLAPHRGMSTFRLLASLNSLPYILILLRGSSTGGLSGNGVQCRGLSV